MENTLVSRNVLPLNTPFPVEHAVAGLPAEVDTAVDALSADANSADVPQLARLAGVWRSLAQERKVPGSLVVAWAPSVNARDGIRFRCVDPCNEQDFALAACAHALWMRGERESDFETAVRNYRDAYRASSEVRYTTGPKDAYAAVPLDMHPDWRHAFEAMCIARIAQCRTYICKTLEDDRKQKLENDMESFRHRMRDEGENDELSAAYNSASGAHTQIVKEFPTVRATLYYTATFCWVRASDYIRNLWNMRVDIARAIFTEAASFTAMFPDIICTYALERHRSDAKIEAQIYRWAVTTVATLQARGATPPEESVKSLNQGARACGVPIVAESRPEPWAPLPEFPPQTLNLFAKHFKEATPEQIRSDVEQATSNAFFVPKFNAKFSR